MDTPNLSQNQKILPSPATTGHFSGFNRSTDSGEKQNQKQNMNQKQNQPARPGFGASASIFQFSQNKASMGMDLERQSNCGYNSRQYVILSLAVFMLLVALLGLLTPTLTQSKVMIVAVNNSMPDGSAVGLHCASKAADFGTHVVPFLEAQFFWFDLTVSGNTRFQCSVTSTNGSAEVDMFVRSRDRKRCQTMCAWFATPEGILNLPEKGPREIANMILEKDWPNLQRLKVDAATTELKLFHFD